MCYVDKNNSKDNKEKQTSTPSAEAAAMKEREPQNDRRELGASKSGNGGMNGSTGREGMSGRTTKRCKGGRC